MEKGYAHIVCLMIICLMLACAGTGQDKAAFYVSQDGNDSWSGTLSEPNDDLTDGPFATLDRARDAVRSLKNESGLPDNGVTVYIRGGDYSIERPLALTDGDSGENGRPVTWRAYAGEKVRLLGGRYINRFEPVTDPDALSRIDESLRGRIVQADLGELGIDDFGLIDPASGRRIELFFKGEFMTVARYPNDDWLLIADVPQTGPKMINKGLDRDKSAVPRGRHYGRFTYPDNRPKRWKDTSNLWVHGYWTWDWSDQYLRVDKLDTVKRDITPVEPHHNYGYTKGQRFYFLNVLEELDSPGEWFLDIDTGILYFWPPSQPGEGDVLVSLLEEPMITLNGASNVMIRGLLFEGGRGNAVTITGGENNTIAGCAFRNFGQTVVLIEGGANNGVTSSDIYDVASGGIDLHGGDRMTLTPAGHYALNNHIHDFGVRLKTYQPAVQTTGVGNRIAHNLIHDAPHCGIFLMTSRMGNDHIIEYNELHALAKETGDVGAIYLCGRDYTMRGNIVRYNYLHDLKGPGLHGVMAIYLDDFTSGTEVYGNICVRASRAVLLGGGRNNTFTNNIFIECDPSIHVDARGIGWAKYYFGDGSRFRELMEKVNYRKPPYSERYPELLTLLDDDPAIPKYNRIERNISTGGRWLDLRDGMDFDVVAVKNNVVGDPHILRWRKPGESKDTTHERDDAYARELFESHGNVIVDGDPGLVNPEGGDFSPRENSPALKLGFEPIPTEKIGLFADDYRREIPIP